MNCYSCYIIGSLKCVALRLFCILFFNGWTVLLFIVGEEIDEETVAKETKSLTEIQAAAVKKRIDTLNATFKKNKRQRRADVRDIFDPQVGDFGYSY